MAITFDLLNQFQENKFFQMYWENGTMIDIILSVLTKSLDKHTTTPVHIIYAPLFFGYEKTVLSLFGVLHICFECPLSCKNGL